LIVRLDAKSGKEEAVAAFLAGALPFVEQEPETLAWFAFKLGESSFAIVDVFPDEQGRLAHLAGPVAAALLEKAGELFLRPPQIERVTVLAAKLPGERGRER
jgi:quinol monooxygenase YgiN